MDSCLLRGVLSCCFISFCTCAQITGEVQAKIAAVLEAQLAGRASALREGAQVDGQEADGGAGTGHTVPLEVVPEGTIPSEELREDNRVDDAPHETAGEEVPVLGYDHFTADQILGTSGDGAGTSEAGGV